jgi:hypothetical protein
VKFLAAFFLAYALLTLNVLAALFGLFFLALAYKENP